MKVATKNQIIDHLQWTSQDYDDRVFQAYWNWCQLHGQLQSIIQQLLANRGVNKWFLQEYEKLENQFLQIVAVAPNNIDMLEIHYKVCTSAIMANYPKDLMDAIKKNIAFLKSQPMTNTIYYAN